MRNLTQMIQEQAATMIPYPPTLATTTATAGGVNGRSGQINTVSIAAGACPPAETAGKNTVAMPVGTRPTNSAGQGQQTAGDVSQWVTSPDPKTPYRFPVLETAVCEYCGAEMPVKRNTGAKRKRFCSTACRVAAHRQRRGHGDGEAGGGRAVVFVVLALIALAWFLWPSLQAARAALAGQAGGLTLINQAGYTAVSPLSNGVVIDTAVSPIVTDQGQGETAVSLPDLMATVEALAAPETAVVPVVPITDQGQAETAVSPIAPITDQGQADTAVSPETVEFWRICADGQASGRRVNPRCPANAAAALAGLQGQGR